MSQRLDVKPAAAHNDRRPSASIDFTDRCKRHRAEFLRAHLFRQRDRIDQMMRHFSPQHGVRLGGKQPHPAIELKSIRANNLSAAARGDVDRQLALAAGRRADDEENSVHKKNRETGGAIATRSPGYDSKSALINRATDTPTSPR